MEQQSNRKQIRQPTQHEKERENLPLCLYDPLKIACCHHYDFPPKHERCEYCLIDSVIDGFDNNGSEGMRWFIAYRTFLKKEEKAE